MYGDIQYKDYANIKQIPLGEGKMVLAKNNAICTKAANQRSCQHEFISRVFYDKVIGFILLVSQI